MNVTNAMDVSDNAVDASVWGQTLPLDTRLNFLNTEFRQAFSKIGGSVPLYSLLITLQEGGGNENEVFFQLRCHWRSLWHHSVVQHVVRHWTHLQPSLCLQSGFQEFARPLWLVSMLDYPYLQFTLEHINSINTWSWRHWSCIKNHKLCWIVAIYILYLYLLYICYICNAS